MDIRSNKNNFKKWLFDGHFKIYLAILFIVLILFAITFSNLKNLSEEHQAPEETQKETQSQEISVQEEQTGAFIPANNSYFIRVNKSNNFITVYKTDTTGELSTPYKTFRCSVNNNVTVSTNQIIEKNVWRKLAEGQYAQYTSRVSSTIYIHSVPYRSQNNSTIITTAYNNLGNPATIGSIYLDVSGAKWIYENCGLNTKVEIYEDSSETPAIELKEKATLAFSAGFDPSDIENNNKVVPGTIAYLRGVNDIEIEVGTHFDEWEGIYAADEDRNNITNYVTINGTVNTNVAGKYNLTYNLIDKNGTVIAYTRTVTVH